MFKEGKPVIVKDNIKNIEDGIKNMKKSIETTQNEILRLEGCLAVFKGFEKGGITRIVPEDYKEPPIPTLPEAQKTESQPQCTNSELPPRPAFLDQQSISARTSHPSISKSIHYIH